MMRTRMTEMNIHKNTVVCPRCDGNGLVYLLNVEGENMCVYVCDECDALWETPDEITLGRFHDFHTYMNQRGIPVPDVTGPRNYDWYKESLDGI